MDINGYREPALLGIPEERHIAVSDPKRAFAFHEYHLLANGGVEKRLFRSKQLAGDVFYVRSYADAVVNGDRGLGYAGGESIRESRYLNRIREEWSEAVRPLVLPFADPVVCVNRPWRNYYHWVLQCMFTIWLLDRFDPREDRMFLLPAKSEERMPSLALLGLDARRIGFFPDRGAFSLKQATYSNAVRTSVTPMFMPYRADLLARAGVAETEGPGRKIYISRRDSPKRKWAIEAELERALEARGVDIVVASELSFEAQMRTFSACDLLIAPHGAGLTNMLFCRPGARVVEVKPSYQNNHAFTGLARVCGLQFALIRAAAADSETRAWSADLAAILGVLDDPTLFAVA